MSSFGCLVLNLFSAAVSLCLYDVILPCTDSLQYLFLSLCRCMFCELVFGHSEITLGVGGENQTRGGKMDYGSRFQRHRDWADGSALSGPVSKGKNHGEEKKAALLMGARDWRVTE